MMELMGEVWTAEKPAAAIWGIIALMVLKFQHQAWRIVPSSTIFARPYSFRRSSGASCAPSALKRKVMIWALVQDCAGPKVDSEVPLVIPFA